MCVSNLPRSRPGKKEWKLGKGARKTARRLKRQELELLTNGHNLERRNAQLNRGASAHRPTPDDEN